MKFYKGAVILLTIIFVSGILKTNCEALDMESTYYEEIELLENDLVYRKCSDVEDGCKKYLIRYDAVKSIVEQLEKLINDNKNNVKLKILLQKIGIGSIGAIGTSLGFYLVPFKTLILFASSGVIFPVVCTINNDIIKPTGETIGYFTKAIIKIKRWFIGDKIVKREDKGAIGNAIDILCGDKTVENQNYGVLENFRKLIFGELAETEQKQIKKYEVYSGLLKNLYEQIKNHNYEDNDVIVVSTDFTNLTDAKAMVKFAKTRIGLKYKKPVEKYFAEVKI